MTRFTNGRNGISFPLESTQQTFTCSISAIESLEKGVKYVQC